MLSKLLPFRAPFAGRCPVLKVSNIDQTGALRKRHTQYRRGLRGERGGLMPELEITCPRTRLTVPTDIAVDAQSLVLTWALQLNVRCPRCGEEHQIAIREAYVDSVLRAAAGGGLAGAVWLKEPNSV